MSRISMLWKRSKEEERIHSIIRIIEHTPHTYHIAAIIKPYLDTISTNSLHRLYQYLDHDNKAAMIPVIRDVVNDCKTNTYLRDLIDYLIVRFLR
jgi:hypothetical protein